MPTATKARVSVNAKALSDGLTLLLPLTRGRTAQTITSHVLLTTDASGVTLRATDLERTLTVAIPGAAEPGAEPTAYVVPAAQFTAFVSGRAGEVTLEETGGGVIVRSGSARVTLPTMSPEDFPQMPLTLWNELAEIPAGEWSRQVGRVTDAVARDETRPAMAGVHLTARGGHLVAEAADGYRLHVVPVMPYDGDTDVILPRAAVETVTRIAAGDAPLCLSASTNGMVRAVCGTATLIAQTIQGAYPNVAPLMPQPRRVAVRVVRADLLAEITRLQAVLSRDIITRLYVQDGQLRVTARDKDSTLDCSATLDCQVLGESGHTALNALYLRDALDAAAGNQVTLRWETAMTPTRIECEPSDGWVGVVMPMFVNWEG